MSDAQDKFVAYDPMMGQFETFKTWEEVEKWVQLQDFCDEIPEEYINGKAWIAEIKYRSKYKLLDRKENYPCIKHPEQPATCYECDGKDCKGAEEWPYEDSFDSAGQIVFVEVETEEARGEE